MPCLDVWRSKKNREPDARSIYLIFELIRPFPTRPLPSRCPKVSGWWTSRDVVSVVPLCLIQDCFDLGQLAGCQTRFTSQPQRCASDLTVDSSIFPWKRFQVRLN